MNNSIAKYGCLLYILLVCIVVQAQNTKGNDSNTPLHALQPDYKIPYGKTTTQDVKQVMDRVLLYLSEVTPTQLADRKSGAVITDLKKPVRDAVVKPGDFRLTSYEWGVTYGAMLLAGEVTGDKRYSEYTSARFKFLAEAVFSSVW
jgi:hypothetical protein